MDIKPYTFKADSTNIVVETVDNRRYTMRDIGRLENRISNLEDYTTLSLLEQQTSNMEIQDADGLNRFKQGFVVDNFTDTTLANTQDPDYNCAIDSDNRELRPAFTQRSVSLVENEPSSRESANYKAYGKVFTLALDSENPHVVLVDQPFASKTENINPFAVATFYGTVSVNPSSDDWFETKYLPDVINQVEGDYLQKKNSLEGTKWNNWQVSWTGATRQTSNNTVQTHTTGRAGKNLTKYYQTTKTYAQEQGQTRTGIKTTVTSRIDYEEVGDRIVSTSEIPYMRSRYLAIKAYGLKPFTRFYPFFDNVGVDYWCTPCSRIEYIPTSGTFDDSSLAGADMSNSARIIETTKNAFWAEETDKTCLDVGDVITATSNTTGVPSHLSAVVIGKSYDGDTGKHYLYVTNIKVNGGKGVDGEYYSSDGVLQNNAKVKTFNANDVISGSISKALGRVVSAEPNHNHIHSPLVSNYAGELYFLFWIPDGDRVDYNNTQTENLTASFNFRCGERVLKVTDSIDNDSQQSESSGENSYSAVGVLNTRQKSINAVRNAVVTTQNVTENRTVTNTWSNTTNSSKYCDPLAETFMVDCKGGCFLSKVDIYFASKDNNLPVTLQIRTVDNGYPSGKILAFGSVTKRPEDVNLSKTQVTFENDQGATVTEFSYDTPTTFEFESPVYVEDGTEYAIVLLSDSTKYRVWIAEVGDNVPNQSVVISKQPYNGVLFKSQNASTWTASQSQDLKFTLYRANFKTDAVANLQFQSAELKPQYLNVNPFQTVKDSGIVRVWHNFHGLYSGSLVSISYDDMKLIDAEPKMLTGQINYSNTTVSVTGSGTLFTKEIEHGDVLYTANDELVGVVNEIQSDTRLTLMEIPNVTATGVQLKRQVSVNGLPITALVGTHEISNVDMHSYVIEVPYKAKATGYAGNDSFKATYNINYDVIQPTLTTQTFSDTAIAYTVDGVTGRSVDGSEIVNQSISGIPVVPNDNNVLLSPLAIMSPDNTTRTSLALNVNFSTTNSALSPVIDSDRVSAILINNSVDSPIETNVNVPSLDNMQLATGGISFVGGVEDVEVTLGSGYTTAQVEFSAPDISGGIRATGKAIIASGQITNIEITESGSGYTKAPTVTIVNADGTGAQTGQVTMSYNQIVTTNETTKKALDLATTGKYLTISNAKTSDNNGTFVITDSMDTDSSRVLVFEKSFTPETDNQAELYLRNLFVSEIAPSGGSVASKYITKVVSLNGSCSMVRTMMALSCPTEADVDVYMKTFTNGGTRGYENIPWAKLESDKAIVKTDVGIDSFNDVSFSYQPEDDFDMMALKIVFRSSNSSAVAKVKDLRMVACA